jgi:ketosteroid isomerase-like protein
MDSKGLAVRVQRSTVVGDHAARLHKAPVEVASAMLTALADGRVEDVVALVDPQVVWVPSIRPGRTLYEGRAGVAQFVADLHAAFGRFRVVVHDITQGGDGVNAGETEVTALIGGFRQIGGGELTLPGLTILFTVRDGLITFMESTIKD